MSMRINLKVVGALRLDIKLRRFAVHGKTVRYISIISSINKNRFRVNE